MKHMSKGVTAATKAQGIAQWARRMTKWLVRMPADQGRYDHED